MKKILTILLVSLLSFSLFSQVPQDNFSIDFEKENAEANKDVMTQEINLGSNLTSNSSSFGGRAGGNKTVGPGLIVGGIVFTTVGILGGTLGGDYEGSTNVKKPFYKQGAHFLTALSGGVCLTTGIIITLN
jgi:hypothetical protein